MAEAQPQARITAITKRDGVAGQVAYDVDVDYDGIPFSTTFIGTIYGGPGPVVMLSGDKLAPIETFVTEPERFGPKLNGDWIYAFYNGFNRTL